MNSRLKPRAIGITLHGKNFRAFVMVRQSQYGSPQPTLLVTAGKQVPWRTLNAAVHYFAMLAELGTPQHERWVIVANLESDKTGHVLIETMTSGEAEAARAVAMLEDVLQAAIPTPPVTA